MAMTAQTSVVRTISLTAAAVAASVAIPFLVHLVPGGSSIGATLLPIFWAPLLAVVFFGPVPGVVAALLAPLLNHVLTGMPPAFVVTSLTIELGVFVAVLVLASQWAWAKRSPLLAPAAYLVARVLAALVLIVVGSSAASVGSVFAGLGGAIPGLISLFVINLLALLLKRRSA